MRNRVPKLMIREIATGASQRTFHSAQMSAAAWPWVAQPTNRLLLLLLLGHCVTCQPVVGGYKCASTGCSAHRRTERGTEIRLPEGQRRARYKTSITLSARWPKRLQQCAVTSPHREFSHLILMAPTLTLTERTPATRHHCLVSTQMLHP